MLNNERFAVPTEELKLQLGPVLREEAFRETILLVGPVWVMTRENAGTKRKEWFAIQQVANGFELICGKTQVMPFLQRAEPLNYSWNTKRLCYKAGAIDTIEWEARGKVQTYQVAVLNETMNCFPAPAKHWVFLQSVDPMLVHQWADSSTKTLLRDI